MNLKKKKKRRRGSLRGNLLCCQGEDSARDGVARPDACCATDLAPSPRRKPITVYLWHYLSFAHWHILSPLVLVVMSLLLNLGSHIKEVRRAAVQCLQALRGVPSKFELVIDHLIPKAEEITSDATYVLQVDHCQRRLRSFLFLYLVGILGG